MSILSLKSEVETIDDVPEKFRPFYAEKDGKFLLDDELVADQAKYQETTRNLRSANKEAADRRRDLKAWTDLGLSLDEAKERLASGDKAPPIDGDGGAPRPAGKDELDRVRTAMQSKHEKDLATEREKQTRLRRQLEQTMIRDAATSAIAASKGMVALLLPHVQASMSLVEAENGDLLPRVVDGQGQVRLNGHGNPMTVAELVEEMKGNPDFRTAFVAETPGGGDQTRRGSAPSPGKWPAKRSDFTAAQKIAFLKEHDFTDFMKLPA